MCQHLVNPGNIHISRINLHGGLCLHVGVPDSSENGEYPFQQQNVRFGQGIAGYLHRKVPQAVVHGSVRLVVNIILQDCPWQSRLLEWDFQVDTVVGRTFPSFLHPDITA